MRLINQLRHKNYNFKKDIMAGVIVALISIPISMGYAQIAGLPLIYGLYGSFLPILVFGLFSTSPQFVVGVDAMPAVMTGGLLSTLAIPAESMDALSFVPFLSIMVALWFLVFRLFNAGKLVKYISTPVMGGFISGVGITIILMQIPKLFGGKAGTGEAYNLINHIIDEFSSFNIWSFILSIITIVVILIMKKVNPRIPMIIVMLVIGALSQCIFKLDRLGIALLPEVTTGDFHIYFPDFKWLFVAPKDILLESFSIAVVIMAQTLLMTNNYALRYGYKVNNNAEIVAYSLMNLAGGLVGCCPINGSVSRSGIADSFGTKSQLMSISAAITMLIVILFGTPLLRFLPVPVLTAIVITALIGIVEGSLAVKLFKTSKNEFAIFMMAFFGVLIFGTINGVIIGIVLAFADVAIGAVAPSTSFMGRIPEQGNYFDLERNSKARPIKNVVIYRFNGNLFFANIDKFQNDIENAIRDDSKYVVVDARGISRIDVTAADRLVMIYNNLKQRGIRFYITEHDGSVNDMLRALGAEKLIESGAVRRTISLALRDCGLHKPYDLEDGYIESANSVAETTDNSKLPEFEWAFGKDAKKRMEDLVSEAIDEVLLSKKPDREAQRILEGHGVNTGWGHIGLFDEGEFLDEFEVRLEALKRKGKITQKHINDIAQLIHDKRIEDESRLLHLYPGAKSILDEHKQRIREHLKERYPKEYEIIQRIHSRMDKKYKLIIFDMDGTILNTLEDLADSLNHILGKHGYDELTYDKVRSIVGNGIYKTVERALPTGTDKDTVDKVYAEYVAYYKEHCAIKTRPYDDIVESIKKLRSMGYMTAVVSNKNIAAVEELVNVHFADCFDEFIGDNGVSRIKPEPDMVNEVLNALGVRAKEALYVGDSDVDVMTGNNANMDMLAVSWGFRDVNVLREAGARAIVDTPKQMVEYIKNS